MMSWTYGEFEIQERNGRKSIVKGLKCAPFGIWFPESGGATVTHLPSGKKITETFDVAASAFVFAEMLSRMGAFWEAQEIQTNVDLRRLVFDARATVVNMTVVS